MSRILVIEDNADLAFGLRNNLEIEGHDVELAGDGELGLARALESRPDLVILDLMLPGLDGFRVLRAAREKGVQTPILILTARGEEADKVRGLKLGADDYVTKPFGLLELLARVEALLRRAREPLRREPIERFGQIEIDLDRRIVKRAGKRVDLSPKEYDLLIALVESRGAVVPRINLIREVWGYAETAVTRTIDTHIAELRRKLERDPSAPQHIITVRKVGYRLQS